MGIYDASMAISGMHEPTVSFMEGWNLISINVSPLQEFYSEDEDRGPNIIRMMAQLRIDEENHHIHLMKNEVGQFYAPEHDFINIPYWNLTEGYQVKVDENVEAVWSGEPIPPDTDIPLEDGWNIIAYFPTYELDASAPDFYVLSPIIDQLLIAKNREGHFMSPEWNFSNMPPWRETQGYQVKVDEDVVLNYPEEEEIDNCQLSIVNYQLVSTFENMSVLVTSVKGVRIIEGDQIVAFSSDGRMTGAGMIDTDGRCGLVVWGDDPSTDVIDGLQKGELFELRLWDASREIEVGLFAGTVHRGNGLVYDPDGFIALDVVAETTIPENFYVSQNYPNPFNSVTRISYGLPEAARVSIRIYNLAGRLVATVVDGEYPAGDYNVVWNAEFNTSGIYIVRMETEILTYSVKVVLIR